MQAKDLMHINLAKWELLEAVSAGNTTATQVAKKTGNSITYVDNQLKLLQAYGYLERTNNSKKKTIGKPAKHYHINRTKTFIVHIEQHNTNITLLKTGSYSKKIIEATSIKDEEELYFFLKLYHTHEELFNTAQLVSYTETNKEETHLLIIATSVEKLREKSNITITAPDGRKKKYVIWSHTEEEIVTGLQRKEEYFINKIKNSTPIWEEEVKLEEYKQLL